MAFFIAIFPIILILVFLFIFKLPSLHASILTFVLTLLMTGLIHDYQLPTNEMVHAAIHGVLISFIAAYVLFFGIFLFHLMDQVGGIKSIASFISERTDDQIMQVLILVVGLSPLIESTSGFGVAFMMVAPIIAAIGFSPFKAALLGLVSLLAVPWGALATGTIIGSELGGIPLEVFGFGTAFMSIPVFAYFILMAVLIAGGLPALKNKWKEILLIYFSFTGSILFFNYFVSVELAGVLSSLLILGIGLVMTRGSKEKRSETSSSGGKDLFKVFSPYIILTVLIFITRVDTPIKEFLETYAVVRLPEYSYELAMLYSPGFWLLITCIITTVIFGLGFREIKVVLKKTIKQWVPFMISTSCFVGISELMSASGMITTISTAAGTWFGQSFIVISALIGAFGGFLTGSTTSSNAMFIRLQVQTAGQIGLPSDLIAFSQNASSSQATMASPARVMLGAHLLNIQSKENEILKKIALVVLGSLLLTVLMAVGMLFFTEAEA